MKMLFFEVSEEQQVSFKKAFPDDELYFYTEPLTLKTIPKEQADAQVISIFIYSEINKAILDFFTKLSLLITRTVGCDHLDCKSLKERDIEIRNTPCYAAQAVAEYTFTLLLALARKIMQVTKTIVTSTQRYETLMGTELKGKTLGIIGLGMIGTCVARIAHGFSMKVVAYDPCCKKPEDLSVLFVDLNELLQQSDVISLHIPLTDTTYHLLNTKNINSIKSGAYLINTSRGAVIDTNALIDALDNKVFTGVALDVLEEEFYTKNLLNLFKMVEPTKEHYKIVMQNYYLMHHPRVMISPHNAFNTQEALQRNTEETIAIIKNWQQ